MLAWQMDVVRVGCPPNFNLRLVWSLLNSGLAKYKYIQIHWQKCATHKKRHTWLTRMVRSPDEQDRNDEHLMTSTREIDNLHKRFLWDDVDRYNWKKKRTLWRQQNQWDTYVTHNPYAFSSPFLTCLGAAPALRPTRNKWHLAQAISNLAANVHSNSRPEKKAGAKKLLAKTQRQDVRFAGKPYVKVNLKSCFQWIIHLNAIDWTNVPVDVCSGLVDLPLNRIRKLSAKYMSGFLSVERGHICWKLLLVPIMSVAECTSLIHWRFA